MNKKSISQNDLSQFIDDDCEIEKYRKKDYSKVGPFLKWAGGKRQLMAKMKNYFPKDYNNYLEPFLGGGAVFFYLLPKSAILIDNNLELINCYKVIKYQINELIHSIRKHKYEKSYYYKIRAMDRDFETYCKLSDVEKASRTIFLNKTGYNGLYRVNSKGQFNVPFGKHKNPTICDEENLRAVHDAIQTVELYHGSFEMCLDHAKKRDFVYLDPPYYPLSDTALFTSYTKESFDKESQIQLFNVFKKLDAIGCQVLLSNSYCDFIVELYGDYRIKTIKAKRAINSDSSKRGFINEVLIMN